MVEAENLSDIIGDIYDAALDPTRWNGALEKCAGFVGGSGAGIWSRHVNHQTSNHHYQCGAHQHDLQLFVTTYHRHDPMADVYFVLDAGDIISNSDVMPRGEFIKTRFYKEWAQPQGLVDNVLTVLDKTPASVVVFAIFRHQRDGLADEAARWRMRLIIPHMRRAMLVGKVIDLEKEEAAAFADTLDGLSAGMFILDANGRIEHSNMSGAAMLERGSPLRNVGGALGASDPHAHQALRDLLAKVGDGNASSSTANAAISLVARDGTPYVARLVPPSSAKRRRSSNGRTATATLFVSKAALDRPSAPEAIARTFSLTPGEMRVLLEIVDSGGVQETAQTLGISQATVKTHLRNLFAKTGSGRQVDLVKLLAGFASPLRD